MVKNSSYLNRTSATLLAIEGTVDYTKADLHLKLFKESLRRLALWANYLSAKEYWPRQNIVKLLDIPNKVNIEHPSRILVEEHLRKKQYHRGFMWRHCLWSLDWALLHDEDLIPTTLPNPYVPMVVAFASGANIYKDNIGWYVTGNGYITGKLDNYVNAEPFLSIDDMTYTISEDDSQIHIKDFT